MTARGTAVRAFGAIAATLALAACTGPRVTPTPQVTLAPTVTASVTPTATASPYVTYTPSPTPSASPSPTASGPIVSAPDGEPVTPEIFMANYDPGAERVAVVVFVREVFETGGSCVVTLTAGARTFSQERAGEADATGTACGQFTFDVSDVTSGSVDVVAYYTSNGHEGLSNTVKVDIS